MGVPGSVCNGFDVGAKESKLQPKRDAMPSTTKAARAMTATRSAKPRQVLAGVRKGMRSLIAQGLGVERMDIAVWLLALDNGPGAL